MARYVYRDGDFRDPVTGEAMPIPERDGICVPAFIPDIQPYLSPVDGKYVSGRAARRDDLKKHNCVEAPPFKRKGEQRLRNERFIKKHGLERVAEC